MLGIGPGSVCDVCLESFGSDAKAPCSIQCGHVFCATCLHHMVQPSCPLCRTHFDQRMVVKLHVDLDNVAASCPTAAEQEAKRLQEAIANVANEGTTEPRLRQLIADATAFLANQPRELFSDLRVTHRMIAYLCEVKSKQRIQRTELDELKLLNSQLESEKKELLRSIDIAASIRKDEKETALAVELSLREHCSRAHAAYETMVERYNFVVQEWMRLNEEVRRIHLPDGSYLHEPDTRIPIVDVRFASDAKSSLSAHSSSHHHHQMKLEEAAVANPDSFLISPLPQFTSRALGTISLDLCSLPELDDDHSKKLQGLYGEESRCDSKHHPVSCRCTQAPTLPEMPHSVMAIPDPNSSSVIEHAVASESLTHSSPTEIQPASSFNDRDMLRHRNRRLTSASSRHSSRSRPSSQAPTRSSSPLRRPVSSVPVSSHSQVPSPQEGSPTSQMTTTLSQLPQGKVNNHRLYDLLQDSNISSSLPNMSSPISRDSHSSRSYEKRDSASRSRSRSSSGRLSSHPLPPVRDVYLDRAAPDPASINLTSSSVYHASSTAVSTASAAAILLEKAKRERRKAEEEERYKEREKTERERERPDRERKTSGRERDKPERDQYRVEDKRTREKQTSSASSYSVPSSHREPTTPNIYANSPAPTTYPTQRTSSHTSSRSGSSALRDPYPTHKQITKAIPVLGTTRV